MVIKSARTGSKTMHSLLNKHPDCMLFFEMQPLTESMARTALDCEQSCAAFRGNRSFESRLGGTVKVEAFCQSLQQRASSVCGFSRNAHVDAEWPDYHALLKANAPVDAVVVMARLNIPEVSLSGALRGLINKPAGTKVGAPFH